MKTIRYHYLEQHNMSMKCTELFLTNKDFEAWNKSMKGKVKNVTIL